MAGACGGFLTTTRFPTHAPRATLTPASRTLSRRRARAVGRATPGLESRFCVYILIDDRTRPTADRDSEAGLWFRLLPTPSDSSKAEVLVRASGSFRKQNILMHFRFSVRKPDLLLIPFARGPVGRRCRRPCRASLPNWACRKPRLPRNFRPPAYLRSRKNHSFRQGRLGNRLSSFCSRLAFRNQRLLPNRKCGSEADFRILRSEVAPASEAHGRNQTPASSEAQRK